MSTARLHIVLCDRALANCHGDHDELHLTPTAARIAARMDGWRTEDGADICPACQHTTNTKGDTNNDD